MKNGRQRSVIAQTLGHLVKYLRFQPNGIIVFWNL